MNVVLGLKRSIARATEIGFVGAAIGRRFRDQVPSRGLVILARGLPPQTKSQLFFRTYESAEIRAVRRFLRRDIDVIELGAGIGVVSCHIRRKLDRVRHLYCVEANAGAAAMIVRNLDRNSLNGNVTIVTEALSYERVPVRFAAGTTHLSGQVGETGGQAIGPTVTLGNLLARFSLAEFSLVSDIEGSEVGLILRDPSALEHCKQMIVELHTGNFEGVSYSANELAERLQIDHGYRLTSRYGNVYVFERS